MALIRITEEKYFDIQAWAFDDILELVCTKLPEDSWLKSQLTQIIDGNTHAFRIFELSHDDIVLFMKGLELTCKEIEEKGA